MSVPHRGAVLLLLIVGACLQVAGIVTVALAGRAVRRAALTVGDTTVLRLSDGVPRPGGVGTEAAQLRALCNVVARMLRPSLPRLIGVVCSSAARRPR